MDAGQGANGAVAMMSPAALSILTTTFQDSDRHKALGVWAGISGLAAAVGLGRVLLDVLLRHSVYAERPGLLPAAVRALVW
jgi:hypothetical protein